MRRLTSALAAAALVFAPTFADAQLLLLKGHKAASGGGGTYSGLTDAVNTGSWTFYGLRAMNLAHATTSTAAIQITNSGSVTCKIMLTSTGALGVMEAGCSGFSGATPATFCGSSTTDCTVATWYDQGGTSGRDAVAIDANAPKFRADCGDGKPCVRFNGSQYLETTSASLPQPTSIIAAVNRTVTASQSDIVTASTGVFLSASGEFTAYFGGVLTDTGHFSETNWNVVGFSGASSGNSSLYVNAATPTTGSAGNLDLTTFYFIGAQASGGTNGLTGYMRELAINSSVSLSSGQQTTGCHNVFAYWGTFVSC